MDSILNSIKKLLGIPEDQDAFDVDIIIHINSAFSELHQMGVGPDECYMITDDVNTWDEFTQDKLEFENVKTYIYLKVKLVFDPPLSSAVLTSIEKTIDKLEFRMNLAAEATQNDTEET